MIARMTSYLSGVRPVFGRELLAEARNPFNGWLRVLGAGVVLVAFVLGMVDQSGRAASVGSRLFHQLNGSLYLAIMIVGPILTADCISREKREGTLGLLFLTPLTGRGIVGGKSLIHIVRAFTIVLSALPLLLLPLLLGGVTSRDIVHYAFAHVGALLFALSAGLIASVRQTEWIRAVVQAELIGLGLLVIVSPLPGLIRLVVAAIWFAWVIRSSGATLKAKWQEQTIAPPQPRWVKLFSTSEFWQSAFRWNKSRTLDRNPIAWLQEYSWTARLTKWGWVIVIFAGEFVAMLSGRFYTWQQRLALLLGLGMAFSGAWSFRRERQSGALELLLVTPLKARHLLGGRIWGLWCHFFPALAILFVFWTLTPFARRGHQPEIIWLHAAIFLTLPFIGLYFSLWRAHFLVAWVLTIGIAILAPRFLFQLISGLTGKYFGAADWALYIVVAFQVILAGSAWWSLHRNLTTRQFAIDAGT